MTRERAPASNLRASNSTIVGIALLLALLAIQISQGPHEGASWRRLWFDSLQQMMPRDRQAQPATIIAIDEESIRQFGQWPWPRNYIAELIWQIHSAGSRSIALDLLFPEPDRYSPVTYARWVNEVDPNLANDLESLGDTDLVMADVVRRTPLALAAAGIVAEGPAAEHPAIGPRVILDGVDPAEFLSFKHGEGSIPQLQQVAAGFGAISHVPNQDRVLRRVSLVQQIVGRPYIMLGAEAVRIADDAAATRVKPARFGIELNLGQRSAPAETNGDFWLHVGPRNQDRYIPAYKILQADADALGAVKDKIALVAVTGLGAIDLNLTPLREAVYGIEAHLQIIEQIEQERFLRRPQIVFFAEILMTLLLGGAAILLLPKASPFIALAAPAGAALLLGGIALVAFKSGLLIDIATPVLAGGLISLVLTGLMLIERDRARLFAELALARARADSAKIEAELAAAWEIQKGLLPPTRRQIEGRVDLTCFIRPARHVGGDFYDHFMIDERRLFFMVGDVSGKGIEASVFMGLSKALWKSVALRSELPLEQVQGMANEAISRDNPNMMFVTGFVGLLDIETGEMHYSSAGHEAPYVFRSGETPTRLPEFSGPPAGLDPDADFPVGHLQLEPGYGVCLFSDGVSEAENPARELYGVERLDSCLAKLPQSSSAQTVVDAVCEDVAQFADGALPSDDLTLLVLIRSVAS